MSRETWAERQAAFTAYLRDPDAPPPPGIEPRRMALYRTLFRNTMDSLLATNFPVIRRTLGETRWGALVDGFHREHCASTPLFTELAQEFIEWLAGQEAVSPPWLPELAHYEWMELRADIDDTPAPGNDPAGDPVTGIPLLSPQAWPLAYAWPVDRIGPHDQPEVAPASPTLLLVRRDAALQVRFAALSPLAFRLLQLVEANGDAASMTGADILRQLAAEAGLPGDAGFLAEAETMLRRLHEEGSVLVAA